MTTKTHNVQKTNEIFNRLCAAMQLSTDERVSFMTEAGYSVSKSKVVAWGSRGKNYAEMPEEALTLFLKRVQTHSKSPLIIFLAQKIVDAGEYERLGVEMEALSELVMLTNREYGYTPANLRHECKLAGGREVFAKLHNIPPATLNKWCHDGIDPSNWRDMPAAKWAEIFNKSNI
ncbi:DUF1456 family protein [Thiolinea disciformis]|uniref:DUF1456 family protein n=1 Tax=Thiolinea disciformis TaxID=125614 RepID=UPI000373A75D|nr:DUF1456 family protein [Thiolinea disciformis]